MALHVIENLNLTASAAPVKMLLAKTNFKVSEAKRKIIAEAEKTFRVMQRDLDATGDTRTNEELQKVQADYEQNPCASTLAELNQSKATLREKKFLARVNIKGALKSFLHKKAAPHLAEIFGDASKCLTELAAAVEQAERKIAAEFGIGHEASPTVLAIRQRSRQLAEESRLFKQYTGSIYSPEQSLANLI